MLELLAFIRGITAVVVIFVSAYLMRQLRMRLTPLGVGLTATTYLLQSVIIVRALLLVTGVDAGRSLALAAVCTGGIVFGLIWFVIMMSGLIGRPAPAT